MNVEKLIKISRASFLNGIRIHFDSICLFNNSSYPSAFYLSVLAKEEIGKSMAFSGEAWIYRRKLGYKAKDVIKNYKGWYLDRICNHKNKQAEFVESTWKNHTRKIEKIFLGEYENAKWKSIFVDLNKNRRMVLPLSKIKENKSKEQITILNDYLLNLCYFVKLDRADRFTDFSINIVEKLLDNELLEKLEKNWNFKSKMCEKLIREWVRILNNKNE